MRNLIWWAVFCAAYFGLAAIAFAIPGGRDFLFQTGLWIFLIPIFMAPFLLGQILFEAIFDAVDGAEADRKNAGIPELTREEKRQERDQRTRNFLVVLVLTAISALPVWLLIETDFARWTLLLGLFSVFSVAAHFFTSKDRGDLGGSDDASSTAERALREQMERELKEPKR
ncbi:MAG: hypothetical protein GC208_08720 [Alphaproteobacteria bacterium]|nr:hypothetical protein [Alphaproteobacteria bacterium]